MGREIVYRLVPKKKKKRIKDKIEVDLLFMVGVVIEMLLMIRLWGYLGFFFFFSFCARRFENERGLPKVGRTFEARRSRIRSCSCS